MSVHTTKKPTPRGTKRHEFLEKSHGTRAGSLVYNTTKECKQCGNILPVGDFRTRMQHGRPYVIARCRKCENEYNAVHHDKELKKQGERKRFSNPKNRKRKNKYQIKWRKKNILKNRAYHRKNIKKNVDEMSDLYIRRMIFHKKNGIHIPSELIKLKRLQLIAKRTIKLKQNEPHSAT